MAETTEQQVEYYKLDANSKLAKRIDDLFFKWFNQDYTLIGDKDTNLDTSDTLTELTKIVNNLLSVLSASKEKSAVEVLNNFTAFMAGDSTAGINVIGDRPQEDHISKLIWLINVSTTVSVLSGELAETKKALDKGPMKKANVSVNNIEKVAIPVKNSKQMKSVSEFVGNVLPSKFQAIAQHKNLAKAVERRSKFGGKEFKNEPTFDTMYEAIGEALIYVSTSFFAEANRAFTEQGKRLATDKVKNIDIGSLPPKEQEKFLQTLQLSFDRNSNYTVELGLLSSLNDKMILDSALCVWYKVLNDQQRADSGFTEQDLKSLPKAIAFSRKFKTQFDAQYLKYSNLFVDGMTAALKKEQEAVEKTWFENKVTGERQFRRGRLAGHGNKFMHTAPMKWLNESLGKKSWASLWAIPKLGMLTLNILTNPTLRKMRKKLTGTLFAGLSSFAQGVAEGFTATGRSTEITYEDVIKKIKEAEDKLKKLTDDTTVVTNESVEVDNDLLLLERDEMFSDFDDEPDNEEEDDSKYVEPYKQLLKYITSINQVYSKKALSDENIKRDRDRYERYHAALEKQLNKANIRQKCEALQDLDSSTFTEAQQILSQIGEQLKQFDDDYTAYEQKAKEYTDDARDAEKGSTLQVGEQTVAICEDVFDTLNKYIARQWNLLAVHSNHADMPLCVEYTKIELPEYVKAAAKKQTTTEMTLTDWLEFNKLFEAKYDNVLTRDQQNRRDSLASTQDSEKTQQEISDDRSKRDVRDNMNDNNGNTTAQYPKKLANGKYQYHGLEIKAAKSDNSKTGFGILADRLIKIAKPVTDFCDFVNAVGRDDARKTFNNDTKELGENPKKQDSADSKASNVNPLESVFVAGYVLNEDIGNRIVTAMDGVTDKVGDKAKSGIKWLGKGAGTGIGKVLHGITHTGTADKDALMAKTGLTYMYDRSLNTAYIVDGAHILKKHCLTPSAEASFEAIATLATALKKSDIANARSIAAVAQSLKSFEQEIGQTKFAPCKTIIDYSLAEKINNGGITDDPTTGVCMIKGVCVRNFDSAKTYASDFSKQENHDIFCYSAYKQTEKAVETNETPTEAPAAETPAEEKPAETQTEAPQTEQPATTVDKTARAVAKQIDKSDADPSQIQGTKEPHARVQDAETPDYKTQDTYQLSQKDADSKLADTYTRDEWRKMNRQQRQAAVKKGAYVDGKQKTSAKLENVDISILSKLFEQINNIDWKDTLHG